MSCSIVAIPFALSHLVGIMAASAAVTAAIKAGTKESDEITETYTNQYQDEVKHIKDYNIIEKEFETVYMDKEILLKTLEEHGISDIEEPYDGKITGSIGSFILTFERNTANKPYIAKISCKDSESSEEKMDDLNSEYALNVQENAYLNLIENLKENNMEIEEEVVEDDNTIVLTINLE